MKGPTEATRYLTFGQLKSPTYRKPDNPDVCFQFWFHVYGEEAGKKYISLCKHVSGVYKTHKIHEAVFRLLGVVG
jgi:hypothetical protein